MLLVISAKAVLANLSGIRDSKGRTSVDDDKRSGLPSTRMGGAVQFEYIPEGETVNQHYYVQLIKRLRLAFFRKRPKKRESRAWTLYVSRQCTGAHSTLC